MWASRTTHWTEEGAGTVEESWLALLVSLWGMAALPSWPPPARGLTGTGRAALLWAWGQELAGGAARQVGTLPPVTAQAGCPLGLQLDKRAEGGVRATEAKSRPLSPGLQAPLVCLVQVRLPSAERFNLSPDLPLTPRPNPQR